MIWLSDIKAGIGAYNEGAVRLADLTFALMELLSFYGVDEIMSELPRDIGDAFAIRLREMFDNSAPLEEIAFGSSAYGEHPHKAAIVARARAWLRQSKSGSGD